MPKTPTFELSTMTTLYLAFVNSLNPIYFVFQLTNLIAKDLGLVGPVPSKVVFTIVHAQENAVSFLGAQGVVPVPSLWTSWFDSDAALVIPSHHIFST